MSPGKHPIVSLIDYVGSGIHKKFPARNKPLPSIVDWTKLGEGLPKGTKVLVHEDRFPLGLGAPFVTDEAGWQGGIHYGSMTSTRDVYDRLRDLGVTHIVTAGRIGDWQHAIGGYLLFRDFLHNEAKLEKRAGPLSLFSMPKEPPARRVGARVAVVSCNRAPATGIYELSALRYSTQPAGPPIERLDMGNPPPNLWRDVDYAVRERNCVGHIATPNNFELVYTRDDREFFVRKPTRPQPEGQ
jgi:hypothetical protein